MRAKEAGLVGAEDKGGIAGEHREFEGA
jgi:hypothetical protein